MKYFYVKKVQHDPSPSDGKTVHWQISNALFPEGKDIVVELDSEEDVSAIVKRLLAPTPSGEYESCQK